VLAGFLSTWIFSIPASPTSSTGTWAAAARQPLSPMRPAIAALWNAYWATTASSEGPGVQLMTHTMRCCAARLVQTAYEASQAAGALSGGAILHLQVAANIMDRPIDAARGLLGLTASTEPDRAQLIAGS
jgi:hypothetical protein